MSELSKLDELYIHAENNGIGVFNRHFSKTKKGACLCSDDFNNVLLDMSKIENKAEETLVLGEELGHIEKGELYRLTSHLPISRINKWKCEYRAKKWRAEKLLPADELQEAIYKCSDMYELSVELEFPIEFIEEALEIYKRNGIEFEFPGRDES